MKVLVLLIASVAVCALLAMGGAPEARAGVSPCDPPDEDCDGVLDIADNCLTTANAGQEDTDGDLVGDVCDPGSGDLDCNERVNAGDVVTLVKAMLGRSHELQPPCPVVGTALSSGLMFGDINCNGALSSADGLLILRHVLNMPVTLPAGCPAIGTPPIQEPPD
jgi:hypothetical protein